jgi:hypothetical protein
MEVNDDDLRANRADPTMKSAGRPVYQLMGRIG